MVLVPAFTRSEKISIEQYADFLRFYRPCSDCVTGAKGYLFGILRISFLYAIHLWTMDDGNLKKNGAGAIWHFIVETSATPIGKTDSEAIRRMNCRPNVASKEWLYDNYIAFSTPLSRPSDGRREACGIRIAPRDILSFYRQMCFVLAGERTGNRKRALTDRK